MIFLSGWGDRFDEVNVANWENTNGIKISLEDFTAIGQTQFPLAGTKLRVAIAIDHYSLCKRSGHSPDRDVRTNIVNYNNRSDWSKEEYAVLAKGVFI